MPIERAAGEKRKRTRRRFRHEQARPYVVPEGTWESVVLVVKEVFPEQALALGSSDSSFWPEIEQKATMKPRSACFQYYMQGRGHWRLAEMVVNSFPGVMASAALDPMAAEQRRNWIEQLAGHLYNYYPEEYRKMTKR